MRSRVLFGHTSLVLNEHLTAGAAPTEVNGKSTDTIVLERVRRVPAFRDVREALHLAMGGTPNRVHKGMTLISLQGRIEAPPGSQPAAIADRVRALELAFDPAECYRDSPTTQGVHALSWWSPTADTTTYPSGWINLFNYVRPISGVEYVDDHTDKAYRQWQTALCAPDPRTYEVDLGLIQQAPGASASLTNNGTMPGPLRVTLAMAGAGNAAFTITRSGVAFVLDLSGCVASDEVIVLMDPYSALWGNGRRVMKNDVDAFSMKTSGPTTWLDVPVGTTTFSHTNTANITSIKYEWGHARP